MLPGTTRATYFFFLDSSNNYLLHPFETPGLISLSELDHKKSEKQLLKIKHLGLKYEITSNQCLDFVL